MSIPKIIHQSAKSRNLDASENTLRSLLRGMHPAWDYRFYDDAGCIKQVEKHFPQLLPIYANYPTSIQKIDLFRVLIVYAVGGFYIDLDVECLKPLDSLCRYSCVLGEERLLSDLERGQLGHRNALRVANYMFACEPKHPFLWYLLRNMLDRSQMKIKTENDILASTGPGLISTIYAQCKHQYRDIVLLRNKDRICANRVCRRTSCHFGNFARHYHKGSWRWTGRGGDPINKPAIMRSIDRLHIDRARQRLENEKPEYPVCRPIYILNTYEPNPHDGLSSVFHRSAQIGIRVDHTRHLSKQKVLVCGIPSMYVHKLSSRNTNIVFTTFESSRLPEKWVCDINDFYHYCIVPHDHVRNVFIDSGVNIPVATIHQGFTRYKRMRKPVSSDRTFRVGFLGIPVKRKNTDKLYRACRNLRRSIPDLKLAVHVSRCYDWLNPSDFHAIESAPFVEWSNGLLNHDEIAQWYSRLSCLVFPSSAEGWSFTPRESLYMGIPTVVSDIPVHRELVDSGYCEVIPSSEKENARYEARIYGKWHRIKTKDIEDAIRKLYNRFGYCQIKALKGSRWIEDKWAYYDARQRLLAFLNQIDPESQ